MRTTALGIVLLALSYRTAFAQQKEPTWNEYTYPADSFAVTLPIEAKPHDSPALPGATAYAVPLETDASSGIVIRVTKKTSDCTTVLSRLKERILAGNDPKDDASSLKDVSIDRHHGLEFKWKRNSTMNLDRWYCVDGRLYILSVHWPSTQAFPTGATRILDSFRLLPSGSQP